MYNNPSSPTASSQSSPSNLSKRRPPPPPPAGGQQRHSPTNKSSLRPSVAGGSATTSSYYSRSSPYAGADSKPSVYASPSYSASGYYSASSPTASSLPPAPQLSGPSSPFGETQTTTSWAPTSYQPSIASGINGKPEKLYYAYNARVACLWILCWCSIFFRQESDFPIQIFLFFALIVYGLDMANYRESVLFATWIFTVIQTLVCLWFSLLAETGDSDVVVLTKLLEAAVVCLFFVATACWLSVQCEWLVGSSTKQQQSHALSSNTTPRQLEATLHALLPPVFASLMTATAAEWDGSDLAATAAPHLFALLLTASMMAINTVESSFAKSTSVSTLDSSARSDSSARANGSNIQSKRNQQQQTPKEIVFVIRRRVAWGHTALLLLAPPLFHISMFWGRILSRYASMDDVYDLVLAATVPYLLLCVVKSLEDSNVIASPYGLSTATSSSSTLVAQLAIPLSVAMIASFCLQQRYLIPLCRYISFHFMGVESAANWLLTLYLTTGTMSTLIAFSVWGRTSPATGQLMFGEYHEDFVQMSLSVTGLTFGKAFGLPWNMTPLPVLGLLGLSLWLSTRMLRYLAILLFVVHATGVVVFTYRFVGIDHNIELPLPNMELNLVKFGMIVTMASILIGLTAGLAVRSSGGYMAKTLKEADVAGAVLIAYILLLIVIEIALIKRPVPTKELAGVEPEEEDLEEMLYSPLLAYFTSAILLSMSLFMRRVRILHYQSSAIVSSLAIGKAVAIFIYSAESDTGLNDQDPRGVKLLCRALVASLLCAAIFAPQAFFEPVHLKSSTRRRGIAGPEIPASATRMIIFYALVFLPLILIATIPYVLSPLVNVISGAYRNDAFYTVASPLSRLIGSSICLWGLSCVSMLNHYLPDGGGEAWKKLSALAFLMGIGVFFAAPSLGGTAATVTRQNPYASISSVGSQLIQRSKSRTGGWGILSAALATLLAVTGPLELKEKRNISGKKDQFLLFRTMVFSLMFGAGVAWFITVQSMSESDWLFLILTLMASMTLSFLGTVAAVLGYFVETDNFEEVEQVSKTWLIALFAFLPVAGIPQLLRSSAAHPFGSGGWLSTYLTVAGISAFAFSISMNQRQGKDEKTRGIGNLGCAVAWLCSIVVLYGRYGVAGLDSNFDVTRILALPASVFGTIAVAPILFALEDENSSKARGRRVTVTTSRRSSSSSMILLNLPQLRRHNRWFPSAFGTIVVLICASLYAILLRGSGLLPGTAARSHNDAIRTLFGSDTNNAQVDQVLADLAEKTISNSMALNASAKLANSGFWTADGFFGPLLHLAGVFAMIPSLYLLVQQYWLAESVPSAQVTLGLPLNAIPVLLCRGLPGLQTSAVLIVAGATMQLLDRRSTEQASKMRI